MSGAELAAHIRSINLRDVPTATLALWLRGYFKFSDRGTREELIERLLFIVHNKKF